MIWKGQQQLPDFSKRYEGKLEGILGSVSQQVFGQYVHGKLDAAAAAYFVSIIKGHPLADANKRSAVLFTDYFLWINNYSLQLNPTQLYSLALTVAKDERLSYDQLKQAVAKLLWINSELTALPAVLTGIEVFSRRWGSS